MKHAIFSQPQKKILSCSFSKLSSLNHRRNSVSRSFAIDLRKFRQSSSKAVSSVSPSFELKFFRQFHRKCCSFHRSSSSLYLFLVFIIFLIYSLLVIFAQIFVDKLKTGIAIDEIDIELDSGLGVFDGFFASFSMILVSEIGYETFIIAALMAMHHPQVNCSIWYIKCVVCDDNIIPVSYVFGSQTCYLVDYAEAGLIAHVN